MALDPQVIDPSLYAESEALKQREAMATMLAQRSMAPINTQGVVASPLSALAKAYGSYTAEELRRKNETEKKSLYEKNNNMLTSGVEEYMRLRNGSPGKPSQEFEDSAGNQQFSINQAPTPGNPQAAIQHALLSRNPALRSLGTIDYQHELKKNDPYTLNEGDRRFSGGVELSSNPRQPRHAIPADWEKHLPGGSIREPNDPAGVFRLPGPDGQKDVYYVEFEQGQPKGYKKMDSSMRLPQDGGRRGGAAYSIPVSTAQGMFAFDTRTKQFTQLTDAKGAPIAKDTADPDLQRRLAEEKARGGATGKATAGAALSLPTERAEAERAIGLIDQMIGSADGTKKSHPGFSSAVGWTWTPGMRLVEGSKEAGFMALLNQVKGGAFLDAFNKLKGGGAITEIEGVKATEAMTRMSKAQNEKEFKEAAREFQVQLRLGMQLAGEKAATRTSGAAPAPGSVLRFDAQGNPIQ